MSAPAWANDTLHPCGVDARRRLDDPIGSLGRYNSRMELERLSTAVRDFFDEIPPGVVAVYLFGSQARGTATSRSDTDVAILYAQPPAPSLEGIPLDTEADLERVLGVPVQVVVLNQAPVNLVHRVLHDGKLLLDRDPSARIRFEVRARNEFFDLQPILARYRATAGFRPVTDPDLIAKKLALIETSVRELRTLARPADIPVDKLQERFAEHTSQIAIQAILEVASHIVSDERLGEPRTNRELVDLLERNGWLPPDLATIIRRMVGFRNILVHGYDVVDVRIVRDIVEHRLEDLLRFVNLIRSRLP